MQMNNPGQNCWGNCTKHTKTKQAKKHSKTKQQKQTKTNKNKELLKTANVIFFPMSFFKFNILNLSY